MAKDLFSLPIFFIIFRETIEASIVISVLLSFVEQLVYGANFDGDEESNQKRVKAMIRRMRIQIWAGALAGLTIALAIGAAFVAVWYTKLNNLWANAESLWEGIFSILASVVIMIMGLAFLRMDRSRAKWRIKLQAAFAEHRSGKASGPLSFFRKNKNAVPEVTPAEGEEAHLDQHQRNEGRTASQALFLLPFITVLREGLEAVIFIAGVSISQPASATPIAVIVGLIAGLLVGFLIYRGGSAFALHSFLIVSTCILFLVGSGLFSKGVGFLLYYPWGKGAGADVAESGDGPGSYDVTNGVIWHVNYGNPEIVDSQHGGWLIFNAILGWNNTGTYASVLSYIFYWVAIACALVFLKFKEGRVALFGKVSQAGRERELLRAEKAASAPATALGSPHDEKDAQLGAKSSDHSSSDEEVEVQRLNH